METGEREKQGAALSVQAYTQSFGISPKHPAVRSKP